MPQDVNHIKQVIADLEAWRDQIAAAILTLKVLDGSGPTLPSSGPPRVNTNGEVQSDSFFQMTVPDAAEKYLKIVKTTKEIPDISDALLRGGLKTSSKNFNDMTRTVMSRDERFVKVPSGGWGLAEWYPAMRKKARGATLENPTEAAKPVAERPHIKTRKEKREGAKDFSAESLKGRTLQLLNLHPTEMFTAQKATEAMKETHLPSVRAALCALVEAGWAARPEKGQYQSK